MDLNVYLSGVASLLVGGCSLLLAIRVLKAMTEQSSASHDVLRFTALVLIAVGSLGACALTVGTLAVLAWLIVLAIWARVALHFREAQKANLYSTLALAVQKDMPLAAMIAAFAEEQEGAIARRARAFARRLTQGISLPQAIARSRGLLPRDARLAAQVGLQVGDLPAALRATRWDSVFDRTLFRPLMTRLLYVLPAILLFSTFMQLKIVPSFVVIFEDFGIPLPAVSDALEVLFDDSRRIANFEDAVSYGVQIQFGKGPFLSFALGGFSTAVNFSVAVSTVTLMIALYAYLQWRGWLMPRLPGWKRIVNWVDMGVVLRLAALAADKSVPLTSLLNTISKSHPKRSVRSRLRRVVRDTNDGQAWEASLVRHGLLRSADAAVLSSAQRCGNVSWAMREMAESFERRACYRLQALTQVVLPLLLVPIGVATAVFVISFFFPLVVLIKELS